MKYDVSQVHFLNFIVKKQFHQSSVKLESFSEIKRYLYILSLSQIPPRLIVTGLNKIIAKSCRYLLNDLSMLLIKIICRKILIDDNGKNDIFQTNINLHTFLELAKEFGYIKTIDVYKINFLFIHLDLSCNIGDQTLPVYHLKLTQIWIINKKFTIYYQNVVGMGSKLV